MATGGFQQHNRVVWQQFQQTLHYRRGFIMRAVYAISARQVLEQKRFLWLAGPSPVKELADFWFQFVRSFFVQLKITKEHERQFHLIRRRHLLLLHCPVEHLANLRGALRAFSGFLPVNLNQRFVADN